MINNQSQTKSQSTVQIIVPQRAQLIFDPNQAYQAYSLPKIHYKPQYQELPDVQAGRPSIHKQQQEENPKQKTDANIYKEWNVNYKEDLMKRIANKKQLKYQDNSHLIANLRQISKEPPKKKVRSHKTKFRIMKSQKNHPVIENTICEYIGHNIVSKVDKCGGQKDYDESAPFFIPSLAFAEELNEEKIQFKEKYGFDDKTLRRNKLILEEVILLRLQKRERQRDKNKLVNEAI